MRNNLGMMTLKESGPPYFWMTNEIVVLSIVFEKVAGKESKPKQN